MLFLHDSSPSLKSPAIITPGVALIDFVQKFLALVLITPHTVHKSRCSYNQIRTLPHQMVATLP